MNPKTAKAMFVLILIFLTIPQVGATREVAGKVAATADRVGPPILTPEPTQEDVEMIRAILKKEEEQARQIYEKGMLIGLTTGFFLILGMELIEVFLQRRLKQKVMQYLRTHPSASPEEVATSVGADPNTVSKMIDELINSGLVPIARRV